MALLTATKAHRLLELTLAVGVVLLDLDEVGLRNLLLLTVGRLVSLASTLVAYDGIGLPLVVAHHALRLQLDLVMQRLVNPILFFGEVGQQHQRNVRWLYETSHVLHRAVGAVRAKPMHVVDADAVRHLRVMIIAVSTTQLAESSLIERTGLLLLGRARSILGRMSVDTARVHLITVSILLVVLANGDLLRDGRVQERTRLALPTRILQPIDAHLLLPLVSIGAVLDGVHKPFNLINAWSPLLTPLSHTILILSLLSPVAAWSPVAAIIIVIVMGATSLSVIISLVIWGSPAVLSGVASTSASIICHLEFILTPYTHKYFKSIY